MGEIHIYEYKKKNITGAMVVVSFPTVGLVSSIVANFMVNNLELELIAGIISDDFYPAAIINDGIPTPPVRIYAGDHECGPDGECSQLVVITSELPLPSNAFSPLADRIIEWCKEKGCRIVTTIEGVNSPEVPEEEGKIYHVTSTPDAKRLLEGLATEPMDSGMVSGLSGILLYKSHIEDYPVTCFLTEAHTDYPDSRAAATVLKELDKMVPEIKMDAGPLLEQAEVIESQVKQAMARIKPLPPAERPDVPPGMYG